MQPTSSPAARRAAAAALATLLLGAGAAAQAPAAFQMPAVACAAAPQQPAGLLQEPADQAAEDTRTRERKRLLHLARGKVLRAKSRWRDDRWEYRDGRTWRALPPDAVVRAGDERDVLAEATRLGRAAGDEPAARVALAQWMIGEGLYAEALEELDRVLRADPDAEDVLRLLRTDPPPLALPAVHAPGAETAVDAEDLLRFAAGAPPCARELAVQSLGEHAGMDLLVRLEEELGSHSVRRRDFAALALRRLYPGEALRCLLDRAVLDGSDDVRAGASLALRDAEDAELVVPLVRAMSSSHPKVRSHSIQALGNMGYAAAVEPLITHLASLPTSAQSSSWRPPAANIFVGRQTAYVQDYDVEVAQGATIADPQINTLSEGSVLDVRVYSVRAESIAVESRQVRGALAQLTGADPGSSTKAWLEWWETHREEWAMDRFLPPEPEVDATTTRVDSGS